MPPITVSDLIAHYKQTELSLECSAGEERDEYEKAPSTKKNYRIYLSRWIERHWGHWLSSEVRTVPVEQWLHQLTLDQGHKMARGAK